jgi:RNA polymerase sigma-70 factor (sigma-E family)
VTFDEFVTARLPALVRYATALTGDPHSAQEIVQHVMVRLHARWRRISRNDRPEVYVRRAITHEFLSWRHRWPVRHRAAQGAPSESSDTARVWQHLSGLSRQQRAVLVLSYYEGLQENEIADLLGCTIGTVRGHKSRALASLRGAMADPALTAEEPR